MMRTVHIYGSMGRDFGEKFELLVDSVTEAVRLLCAQIPGLRTALEKGHFKINVGSKRGRGLLLDEDTVRLNIPRGDIHVVPVVAGRGGRGGGIGKIIAGSLLVAASFFVPGGGTILASIGLSIALAGVSALLTPKKKKEKTKRSYMDPGQQTAAQGGPVPLIYGRFLITPIVISGGVAVSDSNGLVTPGTSGIIAEGETGTDDGVVGSPNGPLGTGFTRRIGGYL